MTGRTTIQQINDKRINIKDLGDKLTPEETTKITTAKDELKKSLEAGTTADVKAKLEALTNEYHIISTKLYEQAQQAQQAAGGAQAGPNMGGANPFAGAAGGANPFAGAQGGSKAPNGAVDADFEVVDDDKK